MKNADLFVQTSFTKDRSGVEYQCYTDFPSLAGELNFAVFETSRQMGQWEFAAYASYTHERCEAENIGTLGDLFGPEFYAEWNKHRNYLNAVKMLPGARKEVAYAKETLDIIVDQIKNPSDVFPFNAETGRGNQFLYNDGDE